MKRTEIKLDENSISYLRRIVKNGKRAVREVTRANILLLSSSGKRNDEIASILNVNRDTVLRVKKRYIQYGVERSIHDSERPGQPKKYGEKETAEIIALACSSPPEGKKRWSIRLMVEALKKKEGLESINREVVRVILKITRLNHGKEECGAYRP